VAPDFDHIDMVFWSIPKLLAVTEPPNPRSSTPRSGTSTLVIVEMKFRGWIHSGKTDLEVTGRYGV
jgi:hypothetical protein